MGLACGYILEEAWLGESIMADQGNSQLEDMAVSISEHEKRSLADVEKMRKEIHTLQEKRAAAMMNEVVELQKERDVATGRVKILKQTLEGY